MNTFICLRKTYMTLLETLIAISLLSVLLMFVFGFFHELSKLTHLSEQAQKESFQMRYLESRLGFIFERIVNENEKSRTFYFYTEPPQNKISESPSLIFTFNNEVRRDPTFSGDVLARLYVDSDHRLCLAIWPLHVKDPFSYLQEEVLCDNVAAVSYSFYAAPQAVNSDKEITTKKQEGIEKKTPEKDKWHEDEWLLTYEQMPSIVKIVVKMAEDAKDLKDYNIGRTIKTKELALNFVLPSSKNPVHYPAN
jgi:hypothetical protein